MTKTVRSRYTLEFKQGAVRLVQSGQSMAEVSRSLVLVEQTLFNWVKASREGQWCGQQAGERRANGNQPASCRVGPRQDGALHLKKGHGVLRERVAVKYAFIQRQRSNWPVSVMCEVLGVSPGGYHQHFTRMVQGGERSRLSDDVLLVHIKAIHAERKGSYGWPRVWKELLARGIRVGKDRVRKLMQQHGIKARGKRRFKATTNSRHNLPVAPNLLERRFNVATPDQAWAGDITYIATDEGW